jgi:hypothetical protein
MYSLLPTRIRNQELSAYGLDCPSLWHAPQISLPCSSSGVTASCPSVISSEVHVAFRCRESTNFAFDADGTLVTRRREEQD